MEEGRWLNSYSRWLLPSCSAGLSWAIAFSLLTGEQSLEAHSERISTGEEEQWETRVLLLGPAPPGLGRTPGEENDYPLQYSCLENPMDREAWWATVCPWSHKESG